MKKCFETRKHVAADLSKIFIFNGGLIYERSAFGTLRSETRSFLPTSYIETAVTTRCDFYRTWSVSLAH
jgi:hypothetical protein